jgi:hypothetical protein
MNFMGICFLQILEPFSWKFKGKHEVVPYFSLFVRDVANTQAATAVKLRFSTGRIQYARVSTDQGLQTEYAATPQVINDMCE